VGKRRRARVSSRLIYSDVRAAERVTSCIAACIRDHSCVGESAVIVATRGGKARAKCQGEREVFEGIFMRLAPYLLRAYVVGAAVARAERCAIGTRPTSDATRKVGRAAYTDSRASGASIITTAE
jgi:Mg-chelatase subunit ChlI